MMSERRCDDCKRTFTGELTSVNRPVTKLFSRVVTVESAVLCRRCMRKVGLYFDNDDVLKVNGLIIDNDDVLEMNRRASSMKNSFSIERDLCDKEGQG
jgi:hypothetical protein